ncbi:MAG TPA: TlpA disulfide reductase family protein [Gammaproteobacteria bacterium]|nr:TlpA disulfide reductase family protein [Gammaproteobacteria bacterium]
MKKSQLAVLVVLLAAAGLTGGYFLSRYFGPTQSASTETGQPHGGANAADAALATHRPDFKLPDVDGKAHSIGQWDGKVILLNFWATWCPPCRHEIPDFIKLQKAYKGKGLTIVGVAIDTAQNVRDFVDPMGINYPILHGQNEAIDIAKSYGDRLGVLPFTVIIDRSGKVVYRHPKAMTYSEAEKLIKPLL